MRYTFDDADAEERRTHAVLRDGRQPRDLPRGLDGRHPARDPVEDGRGRRGRSTDDIWELYDTAHDWSQARDLAEHDPERLAELQALFDEEAEKHQVFPLDDRVTERENPELAGRLDLHHGRTQIVLGPHTGRLSEEAAPNVKNRSHRITVDLDIPADHPPQSTNGVLVAQGGRFGGWSLYVVAGRPHYAYNCYGTRPDRGARRASAMTPGAHELVAGLRATTAARPASGARRDPDLIDGAEVGAGADRRRPRRTTSPSTRPSTSASTAAPRSSTTTRRCATRSTALIHRVRFDLVARGRARTGGAPPDDHAGQRLTRRLRRPVTGRAAAS